MAAMAAQRPPSEEENLPVPSRNPLPLSASQEAQVREIFNGRVRGYCSDEIKAFAECARGRTFSVAWKCRTLSLAMNNCMAAHATQAEYDRSREEWFGKRMERFKEKERKERRKVEQEQFHRDWWGMPALTAEDLQKKEDKLRLPERVGGYRRKQGTVASGQEEGKKS